MATKDDENRWKVHESIRILVECELERPNHSKQSNVTICMVPNTLRNLNSSAYTPRIISIGPLHKEDQHLRAMEDHKMAYMYRLFCRTMEKSTKKGMEKKMRKCVQAMLGLVTRARACYAPSFTNYDDFELAEMMVIDGCFILELLYRFQYGIGEGDPIFDNILVMQDVKYDLLLLENQIPLFILKILFHVTVKRILNSTPLTDLVFYFFKDMNILNSELTTKDETVEHCHILGLLQSCYKPRVTKRSEVPTISYSATEMAAAGVKFKAQRDKDCLLTVNFKQSSLDTRLGTLFVRETSLEIPVLRIRDSTPSFLRNLIAYEQCDPSSRHYVTSFAFLMDRLIDTKDDVSLLVRSEVLQHNQGASEDVMNLFNDICDGVVLSDFYYSDEWIQLDEYCNRFLGWIRRTYFRGAWSYIAPVSALILFVLTVIQTFCSIRSLL